MAFKFMGQVQFQYKVLTVKILNLAPLGGSIQHYYAFIFQLFESVQLLHVRDDKPKPDIRIE